MWALKGPLFKFYFHHKALYNLNYWSLLVNLRAFPHQSSVIFSACRALTQRNGRESWVGVHHPPPGSTGTGVLPGPRDIACQTRCPSMIILGHQRLGWIVMLKRWKVSEVEKSEETKRNTKRKDRLCEYRMKWFRRDSIPRPSVKMKVKHENVN